MLNSHIIPDFYLLWNNLDSHSLKIRINIHHLNIAMAVKVMREHQQKGKKNKFNGFCIHVVMRSLINICSFWSLSRWVLMCAHLVAFFSLFNIAYNQLIRVCGIVNQLHENVAPPKKMFYSMWCAQMTLQMAIADFL